MKKIRNATWISLALAALCGCPAAVWGQQVRRPSAEPIHIMAGKSVVIDLDTRVTRILLSNPAVIDAIAIGSTDVVVEAKAPGDSSLILWDEAGGAHMLDVTVDLDIISLRGAIDRAYPGHAIKVEADGDHLILTGDVPNQHAEDELLKMADAYSKDVVDSLRQPFAHERQILLKVKVAEVDRTLLNQVGFNLLSTGAGNTIGAVSTQQFGTITGGGGSPVELTGNSGGSSTTFGLSDLLNIFIFRPDINLGATIQALEEKSVLQILAEPNLLALSGSKASFLAGGEFPFPVVQGGQNLGVVTIEFRPFGVRLDFVGTIQDDDTVRLHVAPEVSSLDFTNAVTISGFTVPAIATRRAETDVELRSGQSFAIGGLLNEQTTAQLSKIPGIGDIPILGKLFQSRSVQKSNSELIVIVTPVIVDPVRTGAPKPVVPASPIPSLDMKKFDQNLPGSEVPQKPPQVSPEK
jgi:pilus assembly protein CpaC